MILDTEITILRQVEIPEASIQLRSDHIIHVHYKKNAVLDVSLQLSMREIFLELVDGKKLPFMFTADEGFTLTKEARENARRLEDSSPILCNAMVAGNLAYKIIADFYVRVVKPKGLHRVFSTQDGAIKWLRTFGESDAVNVS